MSLSHGTKCLFGVALVSVLTVKNLQMLAAESSSWFWRDRRSRDLLMANYEWINKRMSFSFSNPIKGSAVTGSAAATSNLVFTWQSVITSSLEVQWCQVHVLWNVEDDQLVCQLICHHPVRSSHCHWTSDWTSQKRFDATCDVKLNLNWENRWKL